ncbi:hypothetical protein D7Y61_18285 [Stenotrophomonas maltophilia]|nr:hypothetical protein [Stenotrophomonas maltophilia]
MTGNAGARQCRKSGTLDIGTSAHRHIGTSAYRHIGTSEHRNIGTSARRHVGTSVESTVSRLLSRGPPENPALRAIVD